MIGCCRYSRALLRPYQRLPFSRRNTAGGVNYNKGALTPHERGDSFTEPEVYTNKSNITVQIKVHRKISSLMEEERKSEGMRRLGIDAKREEELRAGHRAPLTANEVKATRMMDADDTVVAGSDGEGCSSSSKTTRGGDSRRSTESYSRRLRLLMQRETDRRDYMMDRFGEAPTSKQFYALFKQLQDADDADETVERHQKRLAEDHGVYSTTRMDAYMLDDDSYFPSWVQALPYSIRDRVKYGSLGLTEEDEALRVRLGRMPRDRRVMEWKRLKAAKEYRAANEETLTLAELRDARQGKRRFHWLQRKRQKRASGLRRLALRKAEGYEEWPSNAVDYSQRIAFVAQHVENGVGTNGQWPLDQGELIRAKVRRKQEEAERTFLMTTEDERVSKAARVNGGIKELLDSFEKPTKPFKRLSRKVYANRVNAIVHGDQDEHGRQYRKMYGRATRRARPYDSLAEMALEKETRKEPRVYTSGLNHSEDEDWTRRYKSWVDGMPSTRYGS